MLYKEINAVFLWHPKPQSEKFISVSLAMTKATFGPNALQRPYGAQSMRHFHTQFAGARGLFDKSYETHRKSFNEYKNKLTTRKHVGATYVKSVSAERKT
jgi:hypothetical protein